MVRFFGGIKRYQRTIREKNSKMIKKAAEGDETDKSNEKPRENVTVVLQAFDPVPSDAEGQSGEKIKAGNDVDLSSRTLVS